MGVLLTAVAGLIAAPSILQSMMSMFPPFQALLARTGYNQRPDLIPAIEQLITLRLRGVIDHDRYVSIMRQAGMDEEFAQNLYDGAQSYLTAFDYINLWRREKIDEEQLSNSLAKLGFREEEIERAKVATEYYPQPQDIVRFAVREVYNPDAVEKFGLDQDVPEEFFTAAKRGGLSEEFARDYWRAHWVLPSPNQVYEMLHRRLINEDDVAQYMRAADFMPSWRQPLIDISYNPLTRVDVRRMHAMGVLNDQQVYNSYRDIGYNDENAKLMTEFTIRYNAGTEGEPAKDPILQRYAEGRISQTAAMTELVNQGYSLDDARAMIDEADFQQREQIIDLQADALIDSFNRGEIDEEALRIQLGLIGVPNDRLNAIIAREQAQALKRQKSASKSDLDRWFRSGLIDEETYRVRLAAMGYRERDIELYVSSEILRMLDTDVKLMSLTQYTKFYIDGRMTEQEFIDKLVLMGYGQEDINDWVAQANEKRAVNMQQTIANAPSETAAQYRLMTMAQYARLFRENRISSVEFENRLRNLNYHPDDIRAIVMQEEERRREG